MVNKDKEIVKLNKRVSKLEKVVEDFMKKWGPDVQQKRDKRDRVWDEMVRVVSIQNKHKGK
tara:strand:+ start:642 stop:824 length:183 start_codon:yes stop_codon:yes gene_type:complete